MARIFIVGLAQQNLAIGFGGVLQLAFLKTTVAQVVKCIGLNTFTLDPVKGFRCQSILAGTVLGNSTPVTVCKCFYRSLKFTLLKQFLSLLFLVVEQARLAG
jgi:hypothetical protein